MPFPSDQARAQVEAYEQEKRDRARRGGDLPPALEYGLQGVDAGWPLYSATRRYADDDYPVGGVVVEVIPGGADADTGELFPIRYRCLDNTRPSHPWQYLDADEVALPVEGVNRYHATVCVYWLIRQVPQNRAVVRPVDVERLHDAWVLAKAAALL